MSAVRKINASKAGQGAGRNLAAGRAGRPTIGPRVSAPGPLERLKNWFNPKRKLKMQRRRGELSESEDDVIVSSSNGSASSADTSIVVSLTTCSTASSQEDGSEEDTSVLVSDPSSESESATSEPGSSTSSIRVSFASSASTTSGSASSTPSRSGSTSSSSVSDSSGDGSEPASSGRSSTRRGVASRGASTGDQRPRIVKSWEAGKAPEASGRRRKAPGAKARAVAWEVVQGVTNLPKKIKYASKVEVKAGRLLPTGRQVDVLEENKRRDERNYALMLLGSLPPAISSKLQREDAEPFLQFISGKSEARRDGWLKLANGTPHLKDHVDGMMSALDDPDNRLPGLHPALMPLHVARPGQSIKQWIDKLGALAFDMEKYRVLKHPETLDALKAACAGFLPLEAVPSLDDMKRYTTYWQGAQALRTASKALGVHVGMETAAWSGYSGLKGTTGNEIVATTYVPYEPQLAVRSPDDGSEDEEMPSPRIGFARPNRNGDTQ